MFFYFFLREKYLQLKQMIPKTKTTSCEYPLHYRTKRKNEYNIYTYGLTSPKCNCQTES